MKVIAILFFSFIFTSVVSAANSRDLRSSQHFAANLTWSPFNLPFPGAKGGSVYYIPNADWMFGVDYLSSKFAVSVLSIEVGDVAEKNITFQAKQFIGNSFNLVYGIGSRRTTTNLAKDFFDLVTHNYSQTASVLETKYFRFGLGNQWHYNNNMTLAVDWFSIDIPFSADVAVSAGQYASSPANKAEIEDAESILKFYPGAAVIKLQFGYIF